MRTSMHPDYVKKHWLIASAIIIGEILAAGAVIAVMSVAILLLLSLLVGCAFVTEGMPSAEESSSGGPETVAAKGRCGVEIPCFAEDGGGPEGGSLSGGVSGEDDESEGGSDGEESSSETTLDATESSSSSGGPEVDPYGPCGDCWPAELYSSTGECACAPPCAEDAECPGDGVCKPGWGCFLSCDGGCPEGMACLPWAFSNEVGDACFWEGV